MRVRFLVTTASASPSYPFQAGQVIELARLGPDVRQWLRDGRAEIVAEPDEALAALAIQEQAVPLRGKRRGARG